MSSPSSKVYRLALALSLGTLACAEVLEVPVPAGFETPPDTTPPDTTPPDTTPSVCPTPLAVPAVTACDGILLTDAESASVRTPTIQPVPGPGGAPAFRLGDLDDEFIIVNDTPCLRLGENGSDFTVSMWLKVDGDANIIGTSDPYGFPPGFVLGARKRSDGSMELWLQARPVPAYPANYGHALLTSAPFAANEWAHVALVYDSTGPGKSATFTLWLNMVAMSSGAPIDPYRPDFRVGDVGYGRPDPFEVSELRSFKRALSPAELKAQFLERGAAGLSVAELNRAIDRITSHVDGTAVLSLEDLGVEVGRFQQHSLLLDTDQGATERALALVEAWEANEGPIFDSETRTTVRVNATPTEAADYTMLLRAKLQQAVFDHGYSADNVQNCTSLFEGKLSRVSEVFPGSVAPPADPTREHQVSINGTVPAFWGQPVAFVTDLVVRPTGLYLSPGSVAEVTVPDSMVGTGFAVMVGAHTADFSNKVNLSRPVRVSKRFPISSRVTRIANPLGGGIYVLVPYLADAGVQTVTVRGGVVEAPFFSARKFDKTTNEQWLSRRAAPAPWAEFESEKFMMQVPSSWIRAFEDPVALMQKWDEAMDGYSEAMGYPPETRNAAVMYQIVDTDIRHGVYGIGYPYGNSTYNPRAPTDGNANHWFLRNPTASDIEYHELGHAQLPSMFRGETEAIVNLQLAYVLNVKLGVDINEAFARSFGPDYGSSGRTPDQAAVDWMVTVNFRNGAEMDHSNTEADEFRYQHRGYAKYIDVARVFGWPAFTGFRHQEHLDAMNPPPPDGLADSDSRILKMSVGAQSDLTPLLHFWGIHPVEPELLKAAMAAEGLVPSPELRAHLEHYLTLIPRDNAEFNAFYAAEGLNCPDATPVWGCGWYREWKVNYGAAEGTQAQDALRAIIQLYYP